MRYIFSRKYLLSMDGTIRFTSTGRLAFIQAFSLAGIHIDSIRTYEQYLQARQKADPFLIEQIEYPAKESLESLPQTLLRSLFLTNLVEEHVMSKFNEEENGPRNTGLLGVNLDFKDH